MSKQVLAQAVNANLNISSEHQRDLTDSASSRFYVLTPAIVAGMAQRLERIMAKLEVDKEAMQSNLDKSRAAIAAEPLYLLFEKYGHTTAHEKSKHLAHQALEAGVSLAEIIVNDKEANTYWERFTEKQKNIILHPDRYYTGIAVQKALTVAETWS
jgi:adenylosuccinate lyase